MGKARSMADNHGMEEDWDNKDKQQQKSFRIKHVVKPRKLIQVDADELLWSSDR